MGRRLASLLAFLLALGVFGGEARAEPLVADLSDHLIAITAGFTGADLLLFGTTDGPGDVIALVRGPTGHAVVRRKDRLFGIWINNLSLDFDDVPNFYALAASRPLDELLAGDTAEHYGIGLDHLGIHAAGDSPPGRAQEMLGALTRIKIREGLFRPLAGKVTFLGQRLFRADFHFPSNVPTGSYLVEILLVRNGEVASAQTTPLIVSKIGVGADIFQFAHRHAAAYGIAAILIALLAGWMAHLAFRRV
jgi:uncharacterized protein (TIGR02186 family)